MGEASGIRLSEPATGRCPVRAEQLARWMYQLSPELLEFREQAKALLSGPEFASRPGLTLEAQARLSYARFQLVREGLNLRIRDVEERPARLATALELVGLIDATLFTLMNIHYCLCGGSLLSHGLGAAELEPYLCELDSGETIGTFLVTELGYGNNAVGLKTRAEYDPERGDLVLSTPCPEARKFMPNTALSDIPKLGVVMARLFTGGADRGIFPLLVRLTTARGPCAGVSIVPLGDKPAFSLDNALTSFHAVRVPRHCLLLGANSQLDGEGVFSSKIEGRRERFLRSIEQVQLGRLCLSGLAATATGVCAQVAIQYAEQRRTFAPRHQDVCVLEYRNHQKDVFAALAQAYASRLFVEYVLRKREQAGHEELDYTFRIGAALKAHTTYAVERAARICRERCGAAGLLEENRLSAYSAQAQGLITAEGDNQILLIKIARQMLLRQGYVRLHQERPAGLLSDASRLIGLLRERERRLLDELRRAMFPAHLPQYDLFGVWNENINLALETATAHATRLAAEAFWQRAGELEPDHPVLDLFSLFGLTEIGPHLGFYLAEELLSRDEVKAHAHEVDSSCARLRPFARELAFACDVPNSMLRAPLASDDYVAHYDRLARRRGCGS